MASREELYQIVGRAVVDPAFQQQVLNDPEAAASSAGVQLTPDQKNWISSNPTQWQNFLKLLAKPGGVGVLDCHTCIVDGH